LKEVTYPKRLEEHIKKPSLEKTELKAELLKLKQMLESGNSAEALQKIKMLV